ncbi:MAG: MFS transporter, partial [Actinobacteria bacterium]|nr:MFS transporter [Actinomycetota bacterium]
SCFQVVAAGWVIFQLTGSAAAVGAVGLVARVPSILFSTVAGHLADRVDRRTVGFVTSVGQALAAAALSILSAVGMASVATIYALTFVVGLGFALGLPAMLGLVGESAGRDLLPAAVRLNAAGINVARMVGPTIAGVLLASTSAAVLFAVNALSFLALTWVLSRFPAMPARDHSAVASTRDGLRYARRDPAARRLLGGAAIFCVFAASIQELAPVTTARVGSGPSGLGALLGAMGAGALLGAWVLARLERRGLPRHRALAIATTVFAVGFATIAVSTTLWLSLIGMAIGGFFWIWMFTLTNTAIQLTSPPPLIGRMLGLYQLAVIGPLAIGAILGGALAEWIGIGWTFALFATLLAVFGVWSLLNPVVEIDRSRQPEPGALA